MKPSSTGSTSRAQTASASTHGAAVKSGTTVAPVGATSAKAAAKPPTAGNSVGAFVSSKPSLKPYRPVSTPVAKAAGTTPSTVKTVSLTPTVRPVQAVRPPLGAPAAVSVPGPDASPIEERVTYQYNALGRRDPFAPLVGGGYVGAEEQSAPPDVGGIKVVGIVWGADDKFALVEDPRGNSRVLRQGDKVMNGVVDGLRRDAVIVKLTTESGTELIQIPLTRKGDDSNGNR